MAEKIFSGALAKGKNWRETVKEAAAVARKGLGSQHCDLAVAFVSESFPNFDPAAFAKVLSEALPCRVLIGCNSSGVIGGRSEVEMEPAVSILAMRLPDVKLYPFHLPSDRIARLKDGNDLLNCLDLYPPDKPHFFCLVDPASADISKMLSLFNDGYKGLPVVGGLASGSVMGAANWLCLNDGTFSDGAVGVAMVGDIEFEVIVAQGCRPIAKPYVITRAEGNVLYELAGRSALEVVRDVIESLSPKDRTLAEQSLSVGLVMNEQKTSFKRGDFLVRNLVGFDPDSGALMLGAMLKVGQTVQFHVRDAQTSSEDLKEMLLKAAAANGHPRGAILVSCAGRGKGLYGEPDHDAATIQEMRGPLPMTGFFASGEIGPIGSKNYVHGYTSSLVILR